MTTTRLAALRTSIAAALSEPGVVIEPYREGTDCWVDLVHRPGRVDCVVRSPKVERRMTRYEGLVCFGDVLAKEAVVADVLAHADIPTPRVLSSHRQRSPADGPSWMLLEYVPHTPGQVMSSRAQRELGALARQIHHISPVPDTIPPRLAPGQTWQHWVRERILRRVAAAGRYMNVPPRHLLAKSLAEVLASRPDNPAALLHLDLRPPNLVIRDNGISAVLDMANAIIGDPYLELARIRGCGLLTANFLTGYGLRRSELRSNGRVLDAYELDLTALLVVVSVEELNDPALQRAMIGHTAALLSRVCD
jgi:hypothetical protein